MIFFSRKLLTHVLIWDVSAVGAVWIIPVQSRRYKTIHGKNIDGEYKKKPHFWKTVVIRWETFIVGGLIWEKTLAWHVARISSEREDVGEHIELNKQLQYPPFSAKIGTDTFRGRYLFWQANSFSRTKLQGPVVRRPISTSLGLNINPAFFISLFKNPF